MSDRPDRPYDWEQLDADPRWLALIERAPAFNSLSQYTRRLEAERDRLREQVAELEAAIMRLPEPPDEHGDGPDERVSCALDAISTALHAAADMRSRLAALEVPTDAT